MDLNLLAVLAKVIEEGSVTEAARQMNLTQSAVSNALARARRILGDPLLVRDGRRLVPTQAALDLLPHLDRMVQEATAVIHRATASEPRDVEREFTVACGDNHLISDIAPVAELLSKRMPRCSLRAVSIDTLLSTNGLAEGRVDVVIGPPDSLPNVHSRWLYEETGVVVVKRDHPKIRKHITRKMFNAAHHIDVLVTLGKGGAVHSMFERLLAAHGLRREVRISVPSFSAAAMLAASTDYVACLPKRLATAFAQHLPIRLMAPPFPCPAFASTLMWHERTDADPVSKYFRQVVVDALSTN